MNTNQEINEEIKDLQASSQTLQPQAVLEQLLNLAEVLAELERNLPGRVSTDEIFDE